MNRLGIYFLVTTQGSPSRRNGLQPQREKDSSREGEAAAGFRGQGAAVLKGEGSSLDGEEFQNGSVKCSLAFLPDLVPNVLPDLKRLHEERP